MYLARPPHKVHVWHQFELLEHCLVGSRVRLGHSEELYRHLGDDLGYMGRDEALSRSARCTSPLSEASGTFRVALTEAMEFIDEFV